MGCREQPAWAHHPPSQSSFPLCFVTITSKYPCTCAPPLHSVFHTAVKVTLLKWKSDHITSTQPSLGVETKVPAMAYNIIHDLVLCSISDLISYFALATLAPLLFLKYAKNLAKYYYTCHSLCFECSSLRQLHPSLFPAFIQMLPSQWGVWHRSSRYLTFTLTTPTCPICLRHQSYSLFLWICLLPVPPTGT